MGASPFLPLPSTLSIDAVEQQDQTVLVHLHATSPIAPCPRCGTTGSRVHSRYHRTITDMACVGQRLVLKVLVRKWVCASAFLSSTHLRGTISRIGQNVCADDRSVERGTAMRRGDD